MCIRDSAEDAPECLPGAGYEYKAVSAPEDLIPIQEPFGLHEDRANGQMCIRDSYYTQEALE